MYSSQVCQAVVSNVCKIALKSTHKTLYPFPLVKAKILNMMQIFAANIWRKWWGEWRLEWTCELSGNFEWCRHVTKCGPSANCHSEHRTCAFIGFAWPAAGPDKGRWERVQTTVRCREISRLSTAHEGTFPSHCRV